MTKGLLAITGLEALRRHQTVALLRAQLQLGFERPLTLLPFEWRTIDKPCAVEARLQPQLAWRHRLHLTQHQLIFGQRLQQHITPLLQIGHRLNLGTAHQPGTPGEEQRGDEREYQPVLYFQWGFVQGNCSRQKKAAPGCGFSG